MGSGAAALVLLLSPGWIVWQLLGALESATASWNAIAANNDALRNTLISATFSALILTFGALFLLISWRGWRPKWRAFALTATLLPGLVAPVVLGVALIEWWNRAQFAALYDSSLGMVVVGHAARFLPLALALLWAPVARLHPDASFAAQNAGASPFRALFSVEIPHLKRALGATFAAVWALCAGELSVTVLVHGPGGDTLPLPIFNLLHAGLAADVGALCLLLMVLCGAAMSLAMLGTKRNGS
jgi:iron(III) transport system permease protein